MSFRRHLATIPEEKDEDEPGHPILWTLIDNMKHLGKFASLSGTEKKELVIATLRHQLDLPDDLEDFIVALIDVLIKVEDGKIVFNKKISTLSYRGCLGR